MARSLCCSWSLCIGSARRPVDRNERSNHHSLISSDLAANAEYSLFANGDNAQHQDERCLTLLNIANHQLKYMRDCVGTTKSMHSWPCGIQQQNIYAELFEKRINYLQAWQDAKEEVIVFLDKLQLNPFARPQNR